MEAIRTWILSVAGAGILVSIALSLTPDGPVKRFVRFIGGLIMIVVVLNPLVNIKFDSISAQISKYELEADQYQTGITIKNREIMALIIEEKTAAYILDKADELGLVCDVSIKTEIGDNGYPYPYSVTITSNATSSQKKILIRYIESNLAIPEDRQEWV